MPARISACCGGAPDAHELKALASAPGAELLTLRRSKTTVNHLMTSDSTRPETPERGAGAPPQYPGYPPYPYGAPADDEIDLRELWNVVWRGKWIIIAVTAVFAVGSVIYALSLPNIYQSNALLAPSDDAQGGGMSRMAGQLGGLASLAGISMGGAAGDDKVAVAMAVMKSRKFITGFIEKYEVLPELMAVEQWSRGSRELVFDSEIYDAEEGVWVREVAPPKEAKPSSWEAYKKFMQVLSVSQDKDTGFVTVSVEHQSPSVAERWVSLLVDNVNEVMKEKDVAEAQRSIEFLQGQLASVTIADMRTVFYQLIEEQTKTIMLAEVREEYVFSTIDPAVIAEEKTKPKRAFISMLGVVLGGVLGVLLGFIRYFVRLKKH